MMDELKKYVDMLFRHQKSTEQVAELKEEILSNMIARKEDLLSQGLSEAEAVKKAKESISSIEGLMDDCRAVNRNQYHLERAYILFLNAILFWIFTMPLLFVRYASVCWIGLLLTVVSGLVYWYHLHQRGQEEGTVFLSISESQKRKHTAWIVWGIFYIVVAAAIALVQFGSNIWFRRPVYIDGPYALAQLLVRFYIPFLTIFIPLTINQCANIFRRCQKEL